MTSNETVVLAIVDTKEELQYLRDTGTKHQQLECFERLIGLYLLINLNEGISPVVKKIERSA